MIKGRRIYHTRPFKFMDSPWRAFCWSWWKYWLNPKSYWRACRDYYERARYGYAYTDLYSLDAYICQWLPFALRDFYEQDYLTVKWNTRKSARQISIMSFGFDSGWEIISMDKRMEDPKGHWEKNWKNLHTHFKVGLREFGRHFFHLWW